MPSDTALIVMPASNTTLAPELAALLPNFPNQPVARVTFAAPLSADTIPAYAEATLAAIEPHRAANPGIVIFGCTAAGFLAGAAGNQAVADRLAARTRAPVVSAAAAMVAVLHHERARRVAVLTPYLQQVNEGLTAYLAAEHIEAATLDTLACPDLAALCAVTAEQVHARALAMDFTGCDALFIACTQLPTAGILAGLRARLPCPVWTSNTALAWAANRTGVLEQAA